MASTTVHVVAAERGNMFSGTSLNTKIGATGTLVLYSGTAPTDADTALSGNTVLATLSLASTPVTSTTSGTATFGTITSATAAATGTCSFWRVLDSSSGCVLQGDASASGGGGSLILGTTSIVSGATISVSSATVSIPS
jgi:hypothetical protein